MHGVLREEVAQATVEYAIVTVALLSIVLAIAGLWRAGTDGAWRRWLSGRHPMALPRRRLSTPLRALRTSRCIDIAREDRAQSTVEAAFLLPTFLTLILLALQPVCLLYTRAVMESAAAETARLMTTTTAEDDDLKEFTRRRACRSAQRFDLSCRRAVVVGYRAWPGRCGWRLVRVRFRRGQAVACDRCVCAGYGWYRRGRLR